MCPRASETRLLCVCVCVGGGGGSAIQLKMGCHENVDPSLIYVMFDSCTCTPPVPIADVTCTYYCGSPHK